MHISGEELIDGMAARRVLRSLVEKGPLVTLMAENDPVERLSSVIDQVGPTPNRLEFDHPAGNRDSRPVFGASDSIEISWSDDGMRYRTRALVARVNLNERRPSYTMTVDVNVYRRVEQRSAERIPVTPDDGLRAMLVVTSGTPSLAPIVKDISLTGVHLSVPAERAEVCDLEPKMTARLSLQFRHLDDAKDVASRITIVRMERINEKLVDFGCAWMEPSKDFISHVERFIANKTQASKPAGK